MMLRSRIALSVLPMIAAILACGAPAASPTASETLPAAAPTAVSEAALPTEPSGVVLPTEAAVLPPAGSFAYLDPCTLVTVEEAITVLGVPIAPEQSEAVRNAGGCMRASADQTKMIFVAAGYGDEAKGMMLGGLGLLASLSEDPAVDAYYAEMQANSTTLSLVDFYSEITLNRPDTSAIAPAPDNGYEAVTGIGDAAFYTYTSGDQIAGLTFVAGEKYVALTLKGLPAENARPTIEALARMALERLPEGFYTLNPPAQ